MLTKKHVEEYENLIEKSFSEYVVKDLQKLFEEIKDDYVTYRNEVFSENEAEFVEYYKEKIQNIPCPDIFFWL